MRTQIQRKENVSRTIQSKIRAANQANVHSVLQKYAARNVQRQADDGLEEDLIQGKFETAQREGVEDEEPLQGRFETAQLEGIEDEEPLQGKFSGTVQREESVPTKNETGIPDNMKAGFENLSGFSFDDVRVHYNSDKPAQLQALAYTQGNQVHIAPGQEKHLGHELGHVVQQKQGRVQPTMQLQGVSVNDDEGLEREADEMGGMIQPMAINNLGKGEKSLQMKVNNAVIQREFFYKTNKKCPHLHFYGDTPIKGFGLTLGHGRGGRSDQIHICSDGGEINKDGVNRAKEYLVTKPTGFTEIPRDFAEILKYLKESLLDIVGSKREKFASFRWERK